MSDPLTNIENAQAQRDLGTFAYRIYLGAREDGATRWDALGIVSAWFLALHRHSNDPPEEETR